MIGQDNKNEAQSNFNLWFSQEENQDKQNPQETNWAIVNLLQEDVNSSDFARLWKAARELGINKKEYSSYLHINTRTLDRNLKDKFTLDVDKSEKAFRLYEMIQHGSRTFGNKEKFSRWIRENNKALGREPVELFGTIAGIEIVNNILTRIEHGIFA